MGQCQYQPPVLAYKVDPTKDMGMTLFTISDSQAYNRRGFVGSQTKRLKSVRGVTHPDDYLPSLRQKQRGSKDDSSCRLIHFLLAVQGNPRGVTAKILLTTKAPRLTLAGPPTLDILFQDQTKVRVGFQKMPSLDQDTTKTTSIKEDNAWMATSIHFGDACAPRYRIQMTRKDFPFLIQLFDGKTNTTCASILTYGAIRNQPRIIHAFRGNINTIDKAKEQYYSQLFAVLEEHDGVLAFQNALRREDEKATFCIMLLLRTRMITFNGQW